MQFGPSLDKRRVQGIVRDTPWNGFLELNRMAFSDKLPRNSESRALAVALRMIRKSYPHIQWVVSFADGTQSGDGTIYRAAGFVLTGIKKNTTIWGRGEEVIANITVKAAPDKMAILNRTSATDTRGIQDTGGASRKVFEDAGFAPLPGFQLRYIYFLHADALARLREPAIPYSRIDEMGAGMYRGERRTRVKQAMAGPPAQRQGSADPHAPKANAPRFRGGVALLGMSAFREARKARGARPSR